MQKWRQKAWQRSIRRERLCGWGQHPPPIHPRNLNRVGYIGIAPHDRTQTRNTPRKLRGGLHYSMNPEFGMYGCNGSINVQSLPCLQLTLIPSLLPWGWHGGTPGLCLLCFMLASAVLPAVLPSLGTSFMGGLRLFGPEKLGCVICVVCYYNHGLCSVTSCSSLCGDLARFCGGCMC